ncbi:MAG TPA: sulfatase-like hydrolase/transferase [Pyrinomonadaceae bacterium]
MRFVVNGRGRRRLRAAAACWLAAACAAPAPAPGAGARARGGQSRRGPNVILVVADNLGRGDLGAYGQRRIRTPNLDRMAREGMRFTDAYAPSPVCAPSRASLMTGLHQGHARIRGNTGRRGERVPLYWEFHEGGFAQAVRAGSWKAVRRGLNGAVELYDLSADAGETRDVAARRPALVRRAAEVMRREHVESEDWPPGAADASR